MKKLLLLSAILFFFASTGLLANKTSVEVKAVSEIKKGEEVTLTVNVMHKGNSKMHFTDWVVLKVNGQEVKQWKYDKNNLPAGENFTLEYKLVVTGDITIEAQGNCNMHGSTGINKVTIKAL